MRISRKRRTFSVFKRWLVVLLCLVLLFVTCFISVKPFVFTYAKSEAETIILNAANSAVLNILEKNDISYATLSNVSRMSDGTITGIEIDIEKVNKLKSQISNELAKIVRDNNKYDLNIPIGTLFGNEYTTGYGPKIKFKMQLTETAIIDFESRFESAGINNVLHQIIIKIHVNASVLMMGCTDGFSVSTTALAAQTVIAGKVPDSFTNVIEQPNNDLADEIFNFGELG
ncbi:MAG: sporulation protein YunB [Clostridia bacterium]|nr:sporulation protein YunB [Clostridia bacterium]